RSGPRPDQGDRRPHRRRHPRLGMDRRPGPERLRRPGEPERRPARALRRAPRRARRGVSGHRAALVAAMAIIAGALAAGGAPAPVRAATTDLTLVSDTTYDVLPEAARVHVTSVVTATNHL